ncbi:MAG: hypothetical protein Q8S53_03580, partial [Brevundimonas sp.]|uniref:WD40 repeat domain-containing protein n=1 Tax=Brevundimonas sp. TaxID=1871086 RepID=UPI002732C5EF
LYDRSTQTLLPARVSHPPAVGAVALSEDGHLAVTSGRDLEVRLWDAIAGRSLGIALRHDSFVGALALSPDATRLVTVTDEGEIRIWDTRTGDCLTPGIRQGPGITDVQITADSTDLLYRNDDGWFSLPMPPVAPELPSWFLDLAEGLARRRLTEDGKLETLTLGDEQRAISALPLTLPPGAELAHRMAEWLLRH